MTDLAMLNARRPFLRRTKATAPPDTTEETTTVEPDYPEDEESLEAGRRDAYEAAKKLKAAAASRLEALASQKEAEAFEKEVVASKKEDEASKLEAEAFVRESAERNSTGTTSRPQRRGPNRFKSRKEAVALRKDAIASRKEAIALRKEAEASRKEVERNETSTDTDSDVRIRGRPSLVAVTTEETTIADVTEDAESLESDKRDAYNAAKKIKAAEASRKETLASQKEAEAFEKEVLASKKDEEASKLEADAFVREAAERNSTGTTSRPRGPNRFKTRKEAVALRKDAIASRKEAINLRKEAEASRKEVERNETSVDAGVDARIRTSVVAGTKRNVQPESPDSAEETTTEDADALEAAKNREADRRDAFEAAKRIKAAEASQKETLASQKEADAFKKEVLASKKDDDASKLEAEAFVREAAERNSTGTTSRPQRRGPNRFKTRKEAVALRKDAIASRKEAVASRKQAEASRKEVERNETSVDAGVDARIRGRRPSVVAGARLTERPTSANRNFVRRRQSGGNGSTTTSAPSTSSATVNRRQFRIGSRRRPPTPSSITTTTSTTSQPTTLMLESEELLQDIEDIDAIEDPTLQPRSAKKGSKIQRRPLVNLKDDQNPSATEEERSRQSKKYSSTFKQNQLEDILKKSDELTTEASTTVEDNAETALAIATHQLITAPLPSTEFGDTSRNTEYTSSNTEYTKTPTYEEYTTAFRTIPTQDFVQTTVGETYSIFDTPRVTTVDDFTTADLTTKSRRPVYSTTDYETKTTYDVPKTTSSLRSGGNDRTDLNTGKVTLETYPTTVPRAGYTNIPTFGRLSPTTFEAPKLSTLSRYPTTPVYQTVTNQYVPTTRDYTTARDYTETTDSRSYSTPRTITSRGFSSPNVIISGYTGVQRGEVKFGNDKYATTPEVPENTVKYTTIPVQDTRATRARYTTVSEVSGSTVGYTGSSPEPAGFFTREYLLESPFTKTYDDEYQYLSPTTPRTTTRKVFRKKIQRRISTTNRPTTSTTLPARSTTPTYVPEITATARPRVPSKKPFEKIAKTEPNRTFKPVVNYDYYDDSAEKMALKYAEGTKVILHGKGSIECLDVGNFPHPSSCKKFISCARMEFGALLGWEYVCPQGLSFDPVGGICNWSAGLGCDEKDDA